MKAIIEAGGTKCKWGFVDSDTYTIETKGFNPNCSSLNELMGIASCVKGKIYKEIDSIIYFGAGCSNDKNKKCINDILASTFGCTDIQIFTDLEGAAIAIFGDEPGIAAILGTGTSAGYYNGKHIERQAPSLGFILGDEGSGAYLGKRLIAKIIRNELEPTICNSFFEFAQNTPSGLIKSVYSASPANGYLASFVPFISKNISNVQMRDLVKESFILFHQKHIEPLCMDISTIGFVGGIAFQFNEILQSVYTEKGIKAIVKKEAFDELMKRLK